MTCGSPVSPRKSIFLAHVHIIVKYRGNQLGDKSAFRCRTDSGHRGFPSCRGNEASGLTARNPGVGRNLAPLATDPELPERVDSRTGPGDGIGPVDIKPALPIAWPGSAGESLPPGGRVRARPDAWTSPPRASDRCIRDERGERCGMAAASESNCAPHKSDPRWTTAPARAGLRDTSDASTLVLRIDQEIELRVLFSRGSSLTRPFDLVPVRRCNRIGRNRMANLPPAQYRVDTLKPRKPAREIHSVADSFGRAARLATCAVLPSIRHIDRCRGRRRT